MHDAHDTVHELCEWIGYLTTLVNEMSQKLDSLEGRIRRSNNQQKHDMHVQTKFLESILGDAAKGAISVVAEIAGRETPGDDEPSEIHFFGESDLFEQEIELELQKARELAFLGSSAHYPL